MYIYISEIPSLASIPQETKMFQQRNQDNTAPEKVLKAFDYMITRTIAKNMGDYSQQQV